MPAQTIEQGSATAMWARAAVLGCKASRPKHCVSPNYKIVTIRSRACEIGLHAIDKYRLCPYNGCINSSPRWGKGKDDPDMKHASKLLILILALLLALCAAAVAEEVSAEVPVDNEHFPATDFRMYVSANIDTDQNGALSDAERMAVTTISLFTEADMNAGMGAPSCSSLKGLEYFPNLTALYCVCCDLDSLDVSANPELTTLECAMNVDLKSLDLTHNPKLKSVLAYCCNFKTLNVSKCKKLEALDVSMNRLTKLSVAKNTKLKVLKCADNPKLTKLDVSKNTKLTTLDCGGCGLKTLSVKKNTKLVYLACNRNSKLAKLDVSKNTKLKTLYANATAIKTLDIKKNAKLQNYVAKKKATGTSTYIFWGVSKQAVGVRISRSTKLTAGSKVLYRP